MFAFVLHAREAMQHSRTVRAKSRGLCTMGCEHGMTLSALRASNRILNTQLHTKHVQRSILSSLFSVTLWMLHVRLGVWLCMCCACVLQLCGSSGVWSVSPSPAVVHACLRLDHMLLPLEGHQSICPAHACSHTGLSGCHNCPSLTRLLCLESGLVLLLVTLR